MLMFVCGFVAGVAVVGIPVAVAVVKFQRGLDEATGWR